MEELVQLLRIDGTFSLVNHRQRFVTTVSALITLTCVRLLIADLHARLQLEWAPADLPSVILWISNRGRPGYPWDGKNLALGIEPVCGAFDLGNAVSNASNPIATDHHVSTSVALSPGKPWATKYRISVSSLK